MDFIKIAARVAAGESTLEVHYTIKTPPDHELDLPDKFPLYLWDSEAIVEIESFEELKKFVQSVPSPGMWWIPTEEEKAAYSKIYSLDEYLQLGTEDLVPDI